MGMLDTFFSSPREREAKSRYGQELSSYDDILRAIEGLQSVDTDVGSIGDVRKKYGLTSVGQAYDPARANLATRRAQSLASASGRMSNRLATPESAFIPIEAEYANAFGELESKAAEGEIGQQRYGAGLFQDILGRKQGFGFQKAGTKLGAMGQRSNTLANYMQSISGASGFDDVLALADTISKFIPKPVPTGGG